MWLHTSERTGLAKNFTLLNGQHYGLRTEVPHPESFVAAASFGTMLANAGVKTVKLDCRLLSAAAEQVGGYLSAVFATAMSWCGAVSVVSIDTEADTHPCPAMVVILATTYIQPRPFCNPPPHLMQDCWHFESEEHQSVL